MEGMKRQAEALFPISRDPPEGGTVEPKPLVVRIVKFPISRDPPEGGTGCSASSAHSHSGCFQFLGIPPKGERSQP